MAKETKKSAGSNKAKCKKYSDRMHLERNKVRKLRKTIAHNTGKDGVCHDECAKAALKEALKHHSGK
jgi:hypothetical protein